jgi:hypothetical protein
MNYRNLLLPSLIAVTVGALSACGGGLQGEIKNGLFNPSAKVDKSEFLGTWVVPPGTASKCQSVVASAGVFANTDAQKYTLSDDQVTAGTLTYSDSSCKVDAGELVISYSIQWVPLQFTARQNVVGVSGPLKSVTLGDKDLTSLIKNTSTSTPAYQNVVDVVNGKLAFGNLSAKLSADGYATEIDEPSLIRGK